QTHTHLSGQADHLLNILTYSQTHTGPYTYTLTHTHTHTHTNKHTHKHTEQTVGLWHWYCSMQRKSDPVILMPLTHTHTHTYTHMCTDMPCPRMHMHLAFKPTWCHACNPLLLH